VRPVHPPGLPAGNRPHPPDPGPHGPHRPPAGRRPGLRPAQRDPGPAGAVPARQGTGVPPPRHRAGTAVRQPAARLFHHFPGTVEKGTSRMKRNLKDLLVFCDMDNTLLTAKEGIPECNRTVIRLFTSMGGHFTVASGRPPASIRAALGDIRLSLPAISC